MSRHPDFTFQSTDAEINNLFKNLTGSNHPYSLHFTQEEDFFIKVTQPITVPAFSIHHDFNDLNPAPAYLRALKKFLTDLTQQLPQLFYQLTWFFDPKDIFHPCFLQVFHHKEKKYLYSLRLDLTHRARGCQILQRGSNDVTPEYTTAQIFVESEILPLQDMVQSENGGRSFFFEKFFEQTFKNESGRGYFVTGHWIDGEISKFISKLFVPPGQKIYPYLPLRCRYNSIATTVVHPELADRKRSLMFLSEALEYLRPLSRGIQAAVKEVPFREDLEYFQTLRALAPPQGITILGKFRIAPYLNELEHKEYEFYGELA